MSKKGIKYWIYENKNSLYVGIVGSLIWQIILFIIDIVPNIGSNIFETIENLLYSFAATMSIDRMISILFSFVMGCIFGIGTCKIFYFIVNKINSIKNKIFIKHESDKTGYEEFKHKLNKSLNTLSLFSVIITIILGFDMFAFSLKIEFDLDMASIKPYISNEKFDTLISEWTQMKTKEDYNKIYSTIKEVQKENKLTSTKENLK